MLLVRGPPKIWDPT